MREDNTNFRKSERDLFSAGHLDRDERIDRSRQIGLSTQSKSGSGQPLGQGSSGPIAQNRQFDLPDESRCQFSSRQLQPVTFRTGDAILRPRSGVQGRVAGGYMMPVWMRLTAVSAVTAVVLGLVARLIRNGAPLQLEGGSGTITPEKSSAVFTVAGGGAMVVVGLGAILFGAADGGGLLLACMGLAIGGFMSPSLTHVHDVHWSEHVIEGPSRMFGPTLGLARTSIAWSDLVRTGSTITGYWYVESLDRRRVYWSYLYKGNAMLEAALASKCPGLRAKR